MGDFHFCVVIFIFIFYFILSTFCSFLFSRMFVGNLPINPFFLGKKTEIHAEVMMKVMD